VRFGILGPLECWTDDGRLETTAPRSQRLLAALLIDAGRPVAVNELVRALWDEWPPATARAQVQGRISALRQAFTGRSPRIGYGPAGYTMHLDGAELDAVTFRNLVTRGYAEQERGDLAAAADALRAALACWRGPALAGVDGDWARARGERLEESRLAATESLLRLQLHLGRAPDMLDELPELVMRHPLRERLVELQMRALLAVGRRGDALLAYAGLRARLAEELGLDPEPGLAGLHRDILRGRYDIEPAPSHQPPAGWRNRRARSRSNVRVMRRVVVDSRRSA
jgi:DNA-binding SARP family transcriptional activator